MAEIILDQVTKRLPGRRAGGRQDFTMDIADGEFVILVGPSGCGKSTTLNMIAGLEDITEGELRIGGQVVNNKAPKDRDIAMVFQSYALYPHMTVRQNMGFALKLAKTPQNVIDEKVEEAARILDLTQHLDRKPANLSGGQRQRVAMGRAIVRDPSAFLMDEPLSNLDAKLRVQTRTEISRLQRRLGTTTVYVTHDQTEAMTLGDRVAVMRSGLLQQVASPKELYDTPVNLFVAGFIGSPAMNFMGGSLEDGKLRTSLGDFHAQRPAAARGGGSRNRARGHRGRAAGELRGRGVCVAERTARTGSRSTRPSTCSSRMGSDVFVYFTRGARSGRWPPPSLRSWPRTRDARTPAAPATPSRPGSTPQPASARATTPSSGSTAGRSTCSTRPSGRNLSLAVSGSDGGSGDPPRRPSAQRRPPHGEASAGPGAGRPPRYRLRRAGLRRRIEPVDGGGYLIFRRNRSMISSFHSWVMMSRYRSAATRM